jgi:peptidoglycan/LPS O-acetylase OafA/YrhL
MHSKIHPFTLLQGGLQDLARRPPGNVAWLDVLRTLAILLVFSAHFGEYFLATARVSRLPLFYFGWTGVDLFFVLSGLLIGAQLWKEVQRTGRIRVGRFLLRRGLRIWPLYYSFVAFMLFEIIFAGRSSSGLLADAFFVSNYFHNQIGGSWSLSTEEQFYILAPVCIAFLATVIKPRHLWLLPLFGLVILVAARARFMATSRLPEADLRQAMYFPFHTHADGLAVGMLLGWLLVFRPSLTSSPRFRVALSAAMFAAGVGLYLASHVLFNFTALALIYGAATCSGMATITTSRILNWHGFYLVSRLSYGIYLNHFGILPRLYAVLGGWRLRGGNAAFWICYPICLAVCMAFAAITFQLIEWPFLQIRSRWLKDAARRTEVHQHPAR